MININGVIYHGNNLTIKNGKVLIDGQDMTHDSKEITIEIHGNVQSLKVDSCASCVVHGSAGEAETMSGHLRIGGNVTGNVKTMSGSVTCGDVYGKINTMSGDVTHTFNHAGGKVS